MSARHVSAWRKGISFRRIRLAAFELKLTRRARHRQSSLLHPEQVSARAGGLFHDARQVIERKRLADHRQASASRLTARQLEHFQIRTDASCELRQLMTFRLLPLHLGIVHRRSGICRTRAARCALTGGCRWRIAAAAAAAGRSRTCAAVSSRSTRCTRSGARAGPGSARASGCTACASTCAAALCRGGCDRSEHKRRCKSNPGHLHGHFSC